MNDLTHLADLIRIRNYVNSSVSRIIRGPAESGRIAEFVAAEIFSIQLSETFVEKALDGFFETGTSLAGKSVNVKFRSSNTRRLNFIDSPDPALHPDFYLALRGPKVAADDELGHVLPFVITSVYLFRSVDVIQQMLSEGYLSFGPSLKATYWNAAMIYPEQVNQDLIVTEEQRAALQLFAPV